MTLRFADTFSNLALLDSSDQYDSRVLEHASHEPERQVTTRWVMMEVADALAAPRFRQSARQLLERLENDPDVVVAHPSGDLFHRRLSLYGERADKGWSLTDCISFVVMEDYGLREALTGDRRFEQAGFTVMFPA